VVCGSGSIAKKKEKRKNHFAEEFCGALFLVAHGLGERFISLAISF
jgi:hypothetical protein